MFKVERLVQIMFVILACLSGILLGIGQYQFDISLTSIAICSAIAAFILNDILGWIRFNKWVANIVALVVTAYTLSGFFKSTVTGIQLILIANLLVYLQAVLLFQRKTPRVCWQIMVLSLLQVVVAAAFNPGFGGAVFFVGYILFAGITMMLLTLYADTWQIERRNEFTKKQVGTLSKESFRGIANMGPIVVFDHNNRNRSVVGRMIRHIGWLGLIGILFTSVLFTLMPKSDSVWMGPTTVRVSETGISKEVSLDQTDVVRMTQQSVFRTWFTAPNSEEAIMPANEPYFRGMALSELKIKEGNSTWVAPHHRIYQEKETGKPGIWDDYFLLSEPRRGRRYVTQNVVLEPTNDPLIYGVAPTSNPWNGGTGFSSSDPSRIEFCRPISALTRINAYRNDMYKGMIQNTLFSYRLGVEVEQSPTGPRFMDFWPYMPEYGSRTMEENQPEYRWLTLMDESRYPTLVAKATEIAQTVTGENTLEICQRMESHFLNSDEYTYTLDFRQLERDETIDAAEDFIKNHKTGHCQYFASALVLMLRSQGIPARVVVGFRGGDLNPEDLTYNVREQYAHAWVEAYIRPQDCTDKMRQRTQNGVWLTLDATPASSAEVREMAGGGVDALSYARDIWRDYVLGMDKQSQNEDLRQSLGADPLMALSSAFKSDFWKEQLQNVATNDPNNIWWYLRIIVPILIIFLFIFALAVRGVRVARIRRTNSSDDSSLLRKILGTAISLVSPKLGRFVSGDGPAGKTVEFYQRFARVMKRYGLVREPAQTQLEFANSAAEQFSDKPQTSSIRRSLDQIVSYFYMARFGDTALNSDQNSIVESALVDLERGLKDAQSSTETLNT